MILAAVFIVGIATWFTLGDNSIARAITNQELAEKENKTSSKTNNAATTSQNKEITLVAEDFHCQKERPHAVDSTNKVIFTNEQNDSIF